MSRSLPSVSSPKPPGAGQLAAFLRQTHVGGLGLIDRLKISYRPYICPFGKLLEMIHPGDAVFDIGCGSGQFGLLAAMFRQPSCVLGVEISPRLVSNAKALFEHTEIKTPFEFSVYDGIKFPVALGRADIVFLIDVIHHVPVADQVSFMGAVYDAMQPGSRLIVKDIDASSPLVVFNRLHDWVLSGERGHELRVSELIKFARDAGFDVQSQWHQTMWVYPHYFCVLKKPGALPARP